MAPRGRRIKNDSRNCPPGWAWLLSGIFIGIFLSVIVYLREIAPYTHFPSPADQLSQTSSPTAPATNNTQSPKNRTPTETPPATRFEFYDLLPYSGVNVPRKPNDASQTSDPIQTPGVYTLQVGSFRDERTAQGLKDHLAGLGMPASIQSATINGNELWYRVRVGPFSDLTLLNRTRAQLSDNGIAADVVPKPPR